MNVAVVSITKSLVEGLEHMTAEELIIYEARVSNPGNQENLETAEKLLRYLIAKKHWSPFDMVDLTIQVKTSRAIAQQILRHWSHRFQEFSQRYAEVVDFEPVQIREAGSTTRQGSIVGNFDPQIGNVLEIDEGNVSEITLLASTQIEAHLRRSVELYQALLKAGVAKECARMILPLTTQTTLYMKASVRSWLFYLAQRLDPHAQLEHQQVARAAAVIFQEHFPTVFKSFFSEE